MSHHEQMWAPPLGFCPRRGVFNALWAQVPGSPSVLEEARLLPAVSDVCSGAAGGGWHVALDMSLCR